MGLLRGFSFALVFLAVVGLRTEAVASPPMYSKVSGYSKLPSVAGKTYFLLQDPQQGGSANPLEFPEYARHVERALTKKGLHRIADGNSADFVIFVGYGIGEPQVSTVTRNIPVFGQTGVSNSQTFGHVSAGGSFNATTTNTPSYGITGVVRRTDEVTMFHRWLRVIALDGAAYRRTSQVSEVWRLEVQSDGMTGDLRAVLPLLAFSARDYFGDDTGKQIEVKAKASSKAYKEFLNTTLSGVE